MSGKEIILDFIQYVFLLIISIFCFFYFVLGNRMDLAQTIVKVVMSLGVFYLIFTVKLKLIRRFAKKQKNEGSYESPIVYLTDLDRMKDLMAIISISLLVLLVPLINKLFDKVDVLQALTVFSVFIFLHKVIFKKEGQSKIEYLNNADKVKDQFVIFFIPILLLIIALIGGDANVVDIVQSIVVFIFSYIWHQRLFRVNS